MAGVTLGFLKYVLGLDTLSFRKGMTEAERDLVKLQKSFEKKGQQFQDLGSKMSAFVTLPLAGLAAKGIKEAQETAQAMGQVNAALASMGPVAGRSAEQLSKLADGLETQSLFEADEILRKVTANLLTFGNISGQAFDRAQQAAVDLSTRLGTDLQSSAIMVGKALNDPIKGMTALGRAGVQFSADQKEAIKALVETGDKAGAQALILKELERQVGGAAAAAQNADPFNKLSDAFNQMAEKVGTALLPLIPPLTDAIVSVANAFSSLSPETQKWILIAGGVAAALGPTLIGLGGLLKVIAGIGPLVTALSGGWGLLAKVFAGSLSAIGLVGKGLIALFSNPWLLGAAVLIGGIYLAWKNWDKITAFVKGVYVGVKTWLQDKIGAVFDWVKGKLQAVGDWFYKLYDRVVGHSYIPDMVDGIAVQMQRLDAVMVKPTKKATETAAKSFENLSSLLARLFPEAARKNEFLADLAELDRALKAGKLSADQYREALERLKVDKGLVSIDTVQLENRGGSGDPITNFGVQLPKVINLTQQWGKALGEIGTGALRDLTAGLGAAAIGQAKLGDVAVQTWSRMTAALVELAAQMLILEGVKAIFGASSGAAGFVAQAFGLAGARAAGGPVMSGKSYLVGERGPEIFTPGSSGRVISNDNSRKALGRGGDTYNLSFPGVTNRREARQAGLQAAAALKGGMARATKAGM